MYMLQAGWDSEGLFLLLFSLMSCQEPLRMTNFADFCDTYFSAWIWILNWCRKILFFSPPHHFLGYTNCFWLFWKLRARKFIGAENFSSLQFTKYFLCRFNLLLLQVYDCHQGRGRTKVCWWLLPLLGTVVLGGLVLPPNGHSHDAAFAPDQWPHCPLFWNLPSAVRDRNLLRGIGYLGCFVFQACPCDSRLYPGPHPMESGFQLQGNALSALFPLLSATTMRNKN